MLKWPAGKWHGELAGVQVVVSVICCCATGLSSGLKQQRMPLVVLRVHWAQMWVPLKCLMILQSDGPSHLKTGLDIQDSSSTTRFVAGCQLGAQLALGTRPPTPGLSPWPCTAQQLGPQRGRPQSRRFKRLRQKLGGFL